MFGDPNEQGVITVELLNLNNGEFLRGGGEFFIKYRAKISYQKFKSVYSKIELKRNSEQSWTTIADKIVSNDNELVSYKWSICPNPENANCPEDSKGEPVLYNGNDYKIRITSNRLASQSGTTTSTGVFTIDSGSPVLESFVEGSKGFSQKDASPAKGFVRLDLFGANDSLTNISKVCIKPTDNNPSVIDTCWMPVAAFNASHSNGVSKVMTLDPIPLFLGYTGKVNVPYYLWLMDSAGNISSLSVVEGETLYGIDKTDRLTINQSAILPGTGQGEYEVAVHKPNDPSEALSFVDGFNFKTDASSSVTINKFDNSISGLVGSMGDPGSFVVTSSGYAFVKQTGSKSTKGIYKIDLRTGKGSIFLQQGNHATGAMNVARVNDPLKMALDANEDLWIMDYKENGKVVISKVTGLSSATPVFQDIIGGGTNKDLGEMKATDLEIEYSDNLRWYGAFSSLPDGSLVFSSSDPAIAIKPTVGSAYSLRIYTPSRPTDYQIRSMQLKSTDSLGLEQFSLTGNAVKDFVPYGKPAFSWDWAKGEIGKIFFRFCAPSKVDTNKCAELNYAEFDGQGSLVRYLPNFLPWHLGNESLTYFNDKLYFMNAYQSTMASLPLSGVGSQWASIFSTEGAGSDYCTNGAPSGQCRVRIKDYFVNNQGKVFFIDEDRIRFVDDDGTVQSMVSVK
jgi:hypothetical protein